MIREQTLKLGGRKARREGGRRAECFQIREEESETKRRIDRRKEKKPPRESEGKN